MYRNDRGYKSNLLHALVLYRKGGGQAYAAIRCPASTDEELGGGGGGLKAGTLLLYTQ